MAVNDLVSLLLAEAGGKNGAERYDDMLHIVSVIDNRAQRMGVSTYDVISAPGEFSAWGGKLPAGVDRYRALAVRAVAKVRENGPITDAMFYSTPKAAGNLPRGLKATASTTGHQYFTDPQNRAIETAGGYVVPSASQTQQLPQVGMIPTPRPYDDLVTPRTVQAQAITRDPIDTMTPATAASVAAASAPATPRDMSNVDPRSLVSPVTRTDREIQPGMGLANLLPQTAPIPGGRSGQSISNWGSISYPHEATRGHWSTNLTPEVAESVRMMASSFPQGVTVQSAYRSPDHKREAAKRAPGQHSKGTAYDLNMSGWTDAEKARAVERARMTGATRIGAYARSPGLLHVDFAKGWEPTNGGAYAMFDEKNARMARAHDWFAKGLEQVTVPTPTERPAYAPNSPAVGARAASELQGYRSPAEQARFDAYADYGRSRSAPGARPATVDAVVSGRPGVSATGAGSISLAPPSLPDVAPVPFAPQMAAVDPLTTRAVPTPTPAPRATSVPAVDFPEAPKTPGRQAREAAAKGALMGALTGGPFGAVVGAALGPARSQIMGNIRSNMQGMGRVPVLSGVRDAYRGLFDFGGSGFGGMFSGIPAPNYNAPAFGVGSGYGAIGSVFGAPAGATAYSRSDPNISFTSLGNGYAVQHNSKYGTDITKEPGSYDAGIFSGKSSSKGQKR